MLARILTFRTEEERLRRAMLLHELARQVTWTMNSVTVVVVLLVLSWQRVALTAMRVFAIALFVPPVHDNVLALSTWLQTAPSDDSLDRFCKDIDHPSTPHQPVIDPLQGHDKDTIMLDNAIVCTKQRLLFVNVSFQVKRGELVVVHGPSGAGKTTILRVLSGEATLKSGSIVVPATWSVAYCAQEHWLQTGTIRDNIVFGSRFDHGKYLRVLDACGLVEDLERLAAGDDTCVGPRGNNLSGGQKARVALARACYADADLYLLDCTLDSVDPVVQQDVFDKCVCNLLQHKTIVLVTQNPELVDTDWADRRLEVRAASVLEASRTRKKLHRSPIRSVRVPPRQLNATLPFATSKKVSLVSFTATTSSKDRDKDAALPVHPSVWHKIKVFSQGNRVITWMAFLMVLLSTSIVACDVVLSFFVVNGDSGIAIVIYLAGVACALLTLSLSTWLALAAVGTYSNDKFRSLATHVTQASLHFFDGVQHGELSYRVWSELFDLELGWLWYSHITVRSLTEMLGRVMLTVWLGGVGAAAGMAMVVADWWYLVNNATSRDEMLASGKVHVAHEDWLLETSNGLQCIRLFGQNHQDIFLDKYATHVDTMSKLTYAMVVHNSYTIVRFYIAAAWPLLILIYATVLTEHIGPGALGLLLYYAVTLPGSAMFLSTGLSSISCDLVSVDEIERLTTLAAKNSENTELPTVDATEWLTKGAVRFDNVTFFFTSSVCKPVPVLRNVSFEVNGGEKIGLVGRTGSGKTSIAMALFRIHEVASGRIFVDGVDIRLLSLAELRRRLSIIPQSPVFYRCSIRSYLDPFGDFNDAVLWSALQRAGLAGGVSVGLVTTLDEMLAEDGVNWSVGERQLLSLARSLLKPSKLLVLDEAFSSLEQERDDAVLDIIEKEFASSTVFLITHRMDQVLHFDRILVMENGRVLEMGGVEELLSNPDSRFYEFLENSPLTK